MINNFNKQRIIDRLTIKELRELIKLRKKQAKRTLI